MKHCDRLWMQTIPLHLPHQMVVAPPTFRTVKRHTPTNQQTFHTVDIKLSKEKFKKLAEKCYLVIPTSGAM